MDDLIYGITIDNPWPVKKVVPAIQALPRRVSARIVFDKGQSAASYAGVVEPIAAVCDVMGCPYDSTTVKAYKTADYWARMAEFIRAFPMVNLWEVGNEINGIWVGKKGEVVDKMKGAYQAVRSAGKKSALTLYHTVPQSQDGNGPMLDWANTYVPDDIKSGLDYVLVSFYSQDNLDKKKKPIEPSAAEWDAIFQGLRKIFPAAKLGIGECGVENKPTADYLKRYYGMRPNVDGFIGGWFYWYWNEQMVPANTDMAKAFIQLLK
jgi:hypothetical protein